MRDRVEGRGVKGWNRRGREREERVLGREADGTVGGMKKAHLSAAFWREMQLLGEWHCFFNFDRGRPAIRVHQAEAEWDSVAGRRRSVDVAMSNSRHC